jgi:hypothetical protein
MAFQFTFTAPVVTNASEYNPIILNGKELNFVIYPYNEDGVTMVPMRPIFEALGARVTWIDSSKTVIAQKGDTLVKLTIDDYTAYINGVETPLISTPTIKLGTTMVPLRFVAEALGADVNWDTNTKVITIDCPED